MQNPSVVPFLNPFDTTLRCGTTISSFNSGAYSYNNAFTGLAAVIYTVSVKDGNGCVTTAWVNILDGKKKCPTPVAQANITANAYGKRAGTSFGVYLLLILHKAPLQ